MATIYHTIDQLQFTDPNGNQHIYDITDTVSGFVNQSLSAQKNNNTKSLVTRDQKYNWNNKMPIVTFGNESILVDTVTLNFSKDGNNNWYCTQENPISGFTAASFKINQNYLFKVTWDGVQYECFVCYYESNRAHALAINMGYYQWAGIGNPRIVNYDSFDYSSMPFLIAYDFYRNSGEVQIFTASTAATHTLKIVQIPFTKTLVPLEYYFYNMKGHRPLIHSGSGSDAIIIQGAARASGGSSFAVGQGAQATGNTSMAIGAVSTASGTYSLALGFGATASASVATAIGYGNIASGQASTAIGYNNTSSGQTSIAIGRNLIANHRSQFVFGQYNLEDPSTTEPSAKGNYLEIVGNGGANDNSEIIYSNARTLDWSGNQWLAGQLTVGRSAASGKQVVTFDQVATINGQSLLHGGNINMSGGSGGGSGNSLNWYDGSSIGSVRTAGSVLENQSYTMGQYAVAQGYTTEASGNFAHAEGRGSLASGLAAHAEGLSQASGQYSHAQGYGTIADSNYQHVFGKLNVTDSNNTYVEIVGNGTDGGDITNESTNVRSNIRTLDWSGNETLAGSLTLGRDAQNLMQAVTYQQLINATAGGGGGGGGVIGSIIGGTGITATTAGVITTINHTNSIIAGQVGPEQPQTGSIINIPHIEYDSEGHIISTSETIHEVPFGELETEWIGNDPQLEIGSLKIDFEEDQETQGRVEIIFSAGQGLELNDNTVRAKLYAYEPSEQSAIGQTSSLYPVILDSNGKLAVQKGTVESADGTPLTTDSGIIITGNHLSLNLVSNQPTTSENTLPVVLNENGNLVVETNESENNNDIDNYQGRGLLITQDEQTHFKTLEVALNGDLVSGSALTNPQLRPIGTDQYGYLAVNARGIIDETSYSYEDGIYSGSQGVPANTDNSWTTTSSKLKVMKTLDFTAGLWFIAVEADWDSNAASTTRRCVRLVESSGDSSIISTKIIRTASNTIIAPVHGNCYHGFSTILNVTQDMVDSNGVYSVDIQCGQSGNSNGIGVKVSYKILKLINYLSYIEEQIEQTIDNGEEEGV